jgi:hypothetical protein
MKLFDEAVRSHYEPAGYGQPDFDYLNRSANEPIRKVRDLLENWFCHYPESARSELRQRFRSTKQYNHSSAFFELWLHELLRSLGCSLEVHPPLAGTTRKVDFLVKSPNGHNFYLEAIHVTGESGEAGKSQARLDTLYDSLNRLQSPNFFINLEISGAPKSPIPGEAIRRQIERELSTLSLRLLENFLEMWRLHLIPKWRFQHDGLRITCYPTPKPPEQRGIPGVRTLATTTFGGIIDSEGPIRDAVIGKAKRYGALDLPFIIAINTTDHFISERDVLAALYGSVSGSYEPEILNDSRGVWGSDKNPTWTRVSAVLVTRKLQPSNPTAPVCLYHNPRPRQQYAGELTRLSQVVVKNNRLITHDGESAGSTLGLPLNFPEDQVL